MRHDCDKRPLIEVLGVDDSAIHVGKDLELIGNAKIVAVGGQAVGNNPFPHLLFAERNNHPFYATARESTGRTV